jgi:N-acetylneuraminic acid mutarotase
MPNSKVSVLICIVLVTGAFSAFGASPLDLEKRIAAQTAIEGVYWQHRIWPPDNPGPKPSLGQVLPADVIRAKVEDYLQESQALERLWGLTIQDKDLQAEVERMAASSRAPQVLREIFAALGDDPALVAECVARPLVADRWIRNAYARDPRYHGALKSAIEQSLARRPSAAYGRTLGGEYRETVWVLGGGRPERAATQAGARVVRMDPDTWRDRLALLQAGFKSKSDLPVGVFGGLQEDDENFFVQAVLEKDSDRLRVATAVWRKQPFDEWWTGAKTALDSGASLVTTRLSSGETAPSLPDLTPAACTPDTWTTVQSTSAPTAREAHTAVWTGSEMIVWGGFNAFTQLDTNTGARYNPATDSWTATSMTNAAVARDTHTAVWTGTKMVIWGGGNELFVPKDTGGRYDPATDSWLATATSGAPAARESHTAVWSGSRMVVWGGFNSAFNDVNTGGRYDPVGDGWTATNTTGAPTPRDSHTAIWTGTRMVVWGGEDDVPAAQNSGGRYDPVGNTWLTTSTTGAAPPRWLHTAVWTGSKMIVWGGLDGVSDVNTGGVYDPSGDLWTLTSIIGAPAARDMHVAVWTGSLNEMDVWGGQDDTVTQLNTGGRYNPTSNTWAAISTLAAPIGRRFHTAIWSGTEMIPWGGWNGVDLDSGGRYCSGACVSSPPAGSSTMSAGKQPGTVLISWTAVPSAAAYDVVRGGLNLLRSSGGNFTTATQACLANDRGATSVFDPTAPPAADGFWYLLRGLSCGGPGTYNESVPSQIGSRDIEISASPNTCP